MKRYKILKNWKIIQSTVPGKFAGYAPARIFGRLDCSAGMRMKKENRVFFHTLEDAVRQGYRPCRSCKPMNESDFRRVRHLIPEYASLQEFYNINRCV